MAGEGTVLDLVTKVHLGPVTEGMRQASAAVSQNVAIINSQFRSLMANAQAAGLSTTVFANMLVQDRQQAILAAAALRDVDLGAVRMDAGLQKAIQGLDYSEGTLREFRAAVTGTSQSVVNDFEKMASGADAAQEKFRAGIVATGSGVRVVARGMSPPEYRQSGNVVLLRPKTSQSDRRISGWVACG